MYTLNRKGGWGLKRGQNGKRTVGNVEKEASMNWRLVDAEVNAYFAPYSERSEDACEILQNIGWKMF